MADSAVSRQACMNVWFVCDTPGVDLALQVKNKSTSVRQTLLCTERYVCQFGSIVLATAEVVCSCQASVPR